MMGEVLLIFNPLLSQHASFIRKQTAQLFSKMRFISAQFIALLEHDLWLSMAHHSNRMASLLKEEIKRFPFIELTQPVDANALFVRLPAELIEPLQNEFPFYVWDEKDNVVRWMCSFDTSEEDIQLFIDHIQASAAKLHIND
jgi:threonine aldolase